ncbi:uncharacterized protein LOC112906173 [Agrilus planipennis]|uniref:Uncharacterized protein LOC112906171 n=1 Tax=Agrilus planipennis TaxID=224129 RepID=A0A7F5RI83_AGRPL|nr:uncharacterized protein LOC112906171 [Agrilus planipennis]XP_025835712.1 uncharacterized protein LOC112906173 [Agrilus planipennis]
MFNYIKHFFSVYRNRPKFLFGFHGQLSHDSYNLIGAADDDLYKFLKELNDKGHLNNTILILMSDHGHRFASIRNTIQGKQEERLPFFSFTFPKWFRKKYKQYYTNFVNNLNTLTTPFDIYSTLKTVIDLNTVKNNTLDHRSISLFSKVSPYTLHMQTVHMFIFGHTCMRYCNIPTNS